jgi:hypothetical protein
MIIIGEQNIGVQKELTISPVFFVYTGCAGDV